jgi:hypothetical protein
MKEQLTERPVARTNRKQGFRMLGFRRQLTPEEIATRNAAETAKKIKDIFARKEK